MRSRSPKRFELWHTIATFVALFVAFASLDLSAFLLDLGYFSFFGVIALALTLCAMAYLLLQLIEQATLLARALARLMKKLFPA